MERMASAISSVFSRVRPAIKQRGKSVYVRAVLGKLVCRVQHLWSRIAVHEMTRIRGESHEQIVGDVCVYLAVGSRMSYTNSHVLDASGTT